jgi:hypothetical protein
MAYWILALDDLLCVLTTVLLLQQTYVELDYVSLSGVLGGHVAGNTGLYSVESGLGLRRQWALGKFRGYQQDVQHIPKIKELYSLSRTTK